MSNDIDTEMILRRAINNSDELAISALAHRLDEARGASVATPSDDGRVPIANFDAAVNNRADFLEAVQAFRREFPDLCERPDWYQTVKEADAWLAQNRPELTYIQRLRKAGSAVRAQKDRDEDGDEHYRNSVVEHMKQARRAHLVDEQFGDAPEPTELNYVNTGESDEFDNDRSSVIAEMAAARRAGRETLGD